MLPSDLRPLGSPTPPLTAPANELVVLDPDHPGFRDPVYRARRNEIARISAQAREGAPAPRVAYTAQEHGVWRTVWENLGPRLEEFACREFFEGAERLHFSRQHIPQLADLNPLIEAASGFRMTPVAGLVSARTFHAFLARRLFLSTQYIRHASTPLYTPEPDVVHELVGHAALLAHPLFAELNVLAGEAAQGLSDAAMQRLERVYWYTLEFGVVRQGGELKAYGAGLLSSFGELGRFVSGVELRPVDLDVIAGTPYDPTRYQNVYFVAESLDALRSELERWFRRLPRAG